MRGGNPSTLIKPKGPREPAKKTRENPTEVKEFSKARRHCRKDDHNRRLPRLTGMSQQPTEMEQHDQRQAGQ